MQFNNDRRSIYAYILASTTITLIDRKYSNAFAVCRINYPAFDTLKTCVEMPRRMLLTKIDLWLHRRTVASTSDPAFTVDPVPWFTSKRSPMERALFVRRVLERSTPGPRKEAGRQAGTEGGKRSCTDRCRKITGYCCPETLLVSMDAGATLRVRIDVCQQR